MKVAFVVLSYNSADALLAVLRGLAPQCPRDAVVVVADDGSRPDQVEALRRGLPAFACPVHHVWHPDVGFTASRARNLGALHAAQHAQADYIVFMDGDCVPTPHFVRAHLALAQPGHFVNGSRILLGPALSERVRRRQVELSSVSVLDWVGLRLRGEVNKLSQFLFLPNMPGRVETRFRWKGIRSCNFAIWYRDLAAVNGFDESFQGWGHEDADLVLRLQRHGLARKNGFWATEVFHLWHAENKRDREDINRRRVTERMQQAIVQASVGLADAARAGDVIVTELNGQRVDKSQ
ncbi:glycosyl transferase [Rhodoferax koreense]|uniref:Glycosyl transferase n=1 Tax=Rhodoferax koreensis TaxID=1842727 RepID=A0A1P8JW40_9BURK|nr:glycosyltransferase [Rhodoferax koreense]APW37989.1 glycosyl transferase [Rhodoferax koreense]